LTCVYPVNCLFRSGSESEDGGPDEIDDKVINKLLIVTTTPPHMRKHPQGDRHPGDFTPRAKITAELARVINDGLYYYEQDLWRTTDVRATLGCEIIDFIRLH